MKEDGSGDAMEGVRFARLMLTLALVAATTAAVRWLLTGHKKKVARAKSDATEAEACPGWQGAAGAGGRALETQGRPHSDTASQETDRHACCGTSSSLRVRQALPHDGSSSTESPDTRPQREEELPTNYPTGPQCPRKGTEAAAGVLGIGQCLRYEVRHPRGECSLDPASTAGLTSLGAHSLPPESRGRGLSRSPATDKAATGSDGNHIVQGQGSSESHYSSADPDTSFGAAHVHNGYVLLSSKGESCRAEGVQGETHSVDRGGHCHLQEYTHSPTLLCLVKESDITSHIAETSNSLPSPREVKEPQCTLGPSQVENSSQAVLAVSGSTVFAERIKAGASCADPAEDNLCTHSETGPGSIPEQHSESAASSCAKHLRKTDSTCLKVKCDNGTSETDLCRGDLTVANTMPSREGQRAQETISGCPAAEQGHPQTSLASSMVGLQGPPPGAGESPQQRQGSSISDENSPALTPGHASPHRATQQHQRTPVGRGSARLVPAASDWAIQQPQRTPVGHGSAVLVPAASDWAIQQPQRTPVGRGSAVRVPAASDWAIQQPQRTPVGRGSAVRVPAASDWAIQQPQRTPVECGSAGHVPAASDWAIQHPQRTPVERGSAGLVSSALKELKPKRSVDPEGSGTMDPDIRGAGRHCSFEHSGVMDSSPGGAQLNTKTSHYHGLNVERRNNDLELINIAAGLHPRHSTEKETAQGKPTHSQESVTAEVLEEQEFSTSHVNTGIPESPSTMSSQEMSTIDPLQHSTYEPSSLPAPITSPTGSHKHREEDHGSADRSLVPTNTKTTHQSRERDYDFRERDYELGEQGQIRHLCPQVEHQVYGLTRRPAKTSICPTKDDEQVPVEHPHPELVLPNTTFDAQDFLESTSEVFRHELCNEADSPGNDRIDSRACTSPQQHESPRAQDQAALGSSQSPHEYEGKAEEEHSVNPSIMKEYCHSSNIKYGALHPTQVKQSDTEPVERGLVPARSDPLVFRLKATATAAMGAECANPDVSAGLAPLLKSRTSPYDYAVAKPITSTAVEEMFAQVSCVPHKNPTADHQPTLESVSVTGQSERTRDNVLSSSSRVKKCSDPGCLPVPDSLCSVADEKALPCMATLEADYTREAYVPYSRTDVCAAEPFNLPAVTDAALDSTPAQTNGHSGEKSKAEVADQDIPQIKNTYLMENAHTHIYNACFQDNFPTTSQCNSHLSARDVTQDPAQEQPKEILVPTLFAAAHKSTVQEDDCESSNIGRKDANTMSDSETEVIVVSNGSQVAGLCNGGHTSSLEPVCAENSRATLRNPEVQSHGKTVRPEEAPNKQLGLSPKYTVESEHSESLIEPYKVPTRPASHSKNGSCTQDVDDDFEIETIPDRVHSFNYCPYVSDSGRNPDSESSESGYTTESTITPAFEERSWSSLGTEGDQLETSCLDLLVTLPRATAISESTSKAADQQKTTESTVNNRQDNINVDHLERTNHKNRVNMMDCTTLPLTLNYTHAFESRCMPSEEPDLNFDQSVRVKPNDFNSEDKQSCQSSPTENVISCSNTDSESMTYDMSSYGTGVVEKASDQCLELNETPSPPKTAVEAESISTDESAGVGHGQRTVESKRKKRTGIAGAGIIRSMHAIDDNMHSDMCAAGYLGIVVQTNRKTENTNKSGSDKQICTTQTQDIFSQSTVPQRVHDSESTTNRDMDYTIPGESSLSIQNNPSSSHDDLRAPSTKSPGLLSSKQTHDLSGSSSQTMSLNIRSDQRTEGKELLEIKEPDEDIKSFLLDSTVVDSYKSGYCQTKDMAKMTNIFRDNEIKNPKYFRHTTSLSPPRAQSSPLPSTSTCQRYCTQQLQSSCIQLHSNARIDRTKESERQNSHNNNLLKPFNINTQMEMPPRRSVLQRRGSISKIAENPELRICSAHITSPKTKLPLAKSCEDILSDTPAKNVYSRSKTRSMLCLLTEHYSLPLAKNQECPVEHVAKGSFLNIPETLQFTEDAVKMQLHLGNCLELLKFAKKNGANNIQEAAYTVMSDNYLQVMRDPTIYSQLSGGERDRILQRRTRGKTVMGVAELETIYGLKKTVQNSSWQAVNEVPPESPRTDPQQRAWLHAFDIEKNSWQPLTQVPEEANLKGCSICSMNNYLFLAGGIKGQGKDAVCSNKVFCYNPLTEIWRQICPMNQARSQLKLVPLDGYLYAIGGECLYTVERYDPRLDKWTFKASLPKGSFAVAHEAASCSGEIYVSGGNLFYRLFKYSPLKDLWEECPYNTSRKRSCDMVAIRSFIYRFDIHRDSGVSVFKYNITTKVWNECATMPLSNPLPFRCSVLDGTVYCLNKNMTVRFTADDGSHRFEQGTLRPFTGGGRGTLCPFVLTIPQTASLQTSV